MENITINTDFIKLDQLLKYANIAENGADAKYIITNGFVKLNGKTEIRRGKKVYNEDIVEINYENQYFSVKVIKQ